MAQARHGRPRVLIALIVFFVLLPPANYLVRAHLAKVPLAHFTHILNPGDLLGLIALVFPLAVGLALALLRAWGFALFMIYAPTLIAFNVRSYIERPYLFNAGALVQSALAFALVVYFMRRDVYKPLLAGSARGWRSKRRWNIVIDIDVDGVTLATRDFGENGCYVRGAAARAVGDPVMLEFELGGRRFALSGVIARVDGQGAGIQFRDLGRADARTLKALLHAAAPRDPSLPLLSSLVAAGAILVVGSAGGLLLVRGHPRRVVEPIPPPSGPSACELAYANPPWRGKLPSGETFSKRCAALSPSEERCLQPGVAAQPECGAVRDRLLAP